MHVEKPESSAFGAGALRAIDLSIERLTWQRTLFAERPRRSDLLGLDGGWGLKPLKLYVHRNHAFEPVASLAERFLAYSGWRAEIEYSPYDDTLSFVSWPGDADVELIWLDFRRYEVDQLFDWFVGRVRQLRSGSRAPILVCDWPEDSPSGPSFNERLRETLSAMPDIFVCPVHELHGELGPRFYDERISAVAGTSLGNQACIGIARLLGTSWIPAALGSGVKAIVLDLDNTLYAGVLAEDGPIGVRLTPAHRALQERLVELHGMGVFLAVASRNELDDVQALLDARTDFPLQRRHFSRLEINWEGKAAAIRNISAYLRIGADTIVFVDDNAGELASVATAHPGIGLLHASDDAHLTERTLSNYPGIFRWRLDETDALRIRDLEADQLRSSFGAENQDPMTVLKSLNVTLDFMLDDHEFVPRVHSLVNKTNQFVLSFSRFSQGDVMDFIEAKGKHCVAFRLRDKLSDSGIVGAVFLSHESGAIRVDEVCISCRALGRNLEDLMILGALRQAMAAGVSAERARFRWVRGPRNQPALQWLAACSGQELDGEDGAVDVPISLRQLDELRDRFPVTIGTGA